MNLTSKTAMIAVMAALILAGGTLFQTARAEAPSTYDLIFIEIKPQDTAKATVLLKQEADTARQESGNIGFVSLRRYKVPTQFAMVGLWRDHAALLAYQSDSTTQNFLRALTPLLIAPYDERPHGATWTQTNSDRKVLATHNPNLVIVLTHIDMFAVQLPAGLKLLSALYDESRMQPGNLAFDVLNQSSRSNHFSLFQAWSDQAALNDYMEQNYVLRFRDVEIKIGGSLYDQRIFKIIQ